MHKFNHSKHGDKAAAAKAFAKALHDSWGVGNPACQNGVLLFLAVDSREVRCTTSYHNYQNLLEFMLHRPVKDRGHGSKATSMLQQLVLLVTPV